MGATLAGLAFTIPVLRAAYAAGIDPQEVFAEMHRRMLAADDPGIFLDQLPLEALLAEAKALGRWTPDLPLWGMPFAVKDNIDVAGLVTTAACPAFAYRAEADAGVVARLRAAGAVPVAKTNLDQFATGLVGVRTPFPVPRNAIDPEIVPGGSSSGSAVAVARGILPFALGTDTAGSGRVPAGLNNIVGLKPSLGAISATGVVPACRTLDTVSVFAMTVADAFAVLQAAAGYDPRDPFSRPLPVGASGALPPSLRIGVPSASSRRFFGDTLQAASFEDACARLVAGGARIVPIDFAPFHAVAELLYAGPWVAERDTVVGPVIAADPGAVLPVIREIVGGAAAYSATDAFRARYRLAALRRDVAPLLAAVDLLCVPTFPTFCTLAEIAADPLGPNARLGTYTNFVNLLDLCGLAVPAPARSDGRPGGVTLLAAAGRDALLASLGLQIEAWGDRTLGATRWPRPPSPVLPVRALPGEVEIAVCGAHMAGLPLNPELTRRGGRFLRAGPTTPDYRLFDLPGGPPRRPGLLRVADGGAAVRVEVWSLPTAEIGGFLESIPAPLGLGTVTLADGTAPRGFLCEAVATVAAADVSALGDWRLVIREAAE